VVALVLVVVAGVCALPLLSFAMFAFVPLAANIGAPSGETAPPSDPPGDRQGSPEQVELDVAPLDAQQQVSSTAQQIARTANGIAGLEAVPVDEAVLTEALMEHLSGLDDLRIDDGEWIVVPLGDRVEVAVLGTSAAACVQVDAGRAVVVDGPC